MKGNPGNRLPLFIYGVKLVDLPQSTGYNVTTQSIKDRYGTDVTKLWALEFGFKSVGGNGGNPSSRGNVIPQEHFIVQFD